MYLDELTTYKLKFLELIKNDETTKNLLNISNTPESGNLIYKQIFPYAYVPDVQVDKSVYICFEVEVPRVQSAFYKDVSLSVYVLCHKDLMRTDCGLRTDLLAEAIDNINGNSREYGFGLRLQSVKRIMPTQDYYGAELYYIATDFNGVKR